jgi:hypothetical protein
LHKDALFHYAGKKFCRISPWWLADSVGEEEEEEDEDDDDDGDISRQIFSLLWHSLPDGSDSRR